MAFNHVHFNFRYRRVVLCRCLTWRVTIVCARRILRVREEIGERRRARSIQLLCCSLMSFHGLKELLELLNKIYSPTNYRCLITLKTQMIYKDGEILGKKKKKSSNYWKEGEEWNILSIHCVYIRFYGIMCFNAKQELFAFGNFPFIWVYLEWG